MNKKYAPPKIDLEERWQNVQTSFNEAYTVKTDGNETFDQGAFDATLDRIVSPNIGSHD